jgi:hypothetical protein
VVDLPYEYLAKGPKGARVYVVDYDSSTGAFNPPANLREDLTENEPSKAELNKLATNPAFHAQNAYAIVMRTLARFEFALGRRLSWGFDGHQLHVAPHAFVDANAFYSKRAAACFWAILRLTILTERTLRRPSTHVVLTMSLHTKPRMPFSMAFALGSPSLPLPNKQLSTRASPIW